MEYGVYLNVVDLLYIQQIYVLFIYVKIDDESDGYSFLCSGGVNNEKRLKLNEDFFSRKLIIDVF